MKLGVIGGAGLLGSTSAFMAATLGLADNIVLYDSRGNLAGNHAIDLDQGVCEISPTRVSAGDIDDLSDCDYLIYAAGAPENNSTSRDAYLDDNMAIMKEITDRMRGWARIPVIINASNPIDVLNGKLYAFTGGAPEKYIGYSKNDTLRFKWSVSLATGIPAGLIEGITIGEHGEKQVPVYSSLRRKDTGERIILSPEEKKTVAETIRGQFAKLTSFGVQRTMGWTSGIGIAAVLKAILTDSDEIFPCSVLAGGAYGIDGVSIGLPVCLGRGGVRRIVEIPLDPEEREALAAAAEQLRSLSES
jgi:malate/lactate dehydrogenase